MTDQPNASTPEPASGTKRSAQIMAFVVRHWRSGVFSGLSINADEPSKSDEAAEIQAQEFVADLESMGPAFIKIGQALSTRPDMVPPDYIVALERMQDDVTPLDFSQIRETVESELGVKLNKLFAEFEETPLAAASIAQVHRAVMRDGRRVAVKVQRPGVSQRIRADLDVLSSMAKTADRWTDMGRRIQFSEWVHEFRRSLLAELDYLQEAENLERFGRHFESEPLLIVPDPIWDYSTTKVLTMDLVDGVKATEISGMRRAEQSMNDLAAAVMRGYLDQVFVHGEIHADPHPGNLLVTPDEKIALLDLGMVAMIPPKRRDQLLKLLFAAVDGRGEDVALEMINMGVRLEEFEPDRYQREVGQMVARYCSSGPNRSISEGRLVLDLTLIGTACGLRTPPELSLLGKTLLNLEAVSNALDPDMDVKQVVESHLEHIMRQRMRRAFSPAKMASDAMALQSLASEAPSKVLTLLSLLSENRMKFKLTGLEESHLMENMQKIANRISTGIIIAALIVASAMLMRLDVGPRLIGYPAMALILFVVATLLGLGIVISVMLRDRRAKPKETRGSND